MKQVDAATAAAIEAPERIVTASARVDWLNKGFYSAGPTGVDWDLYEDFQSGTLSSDWTLSNGASYDTNKFQILLPGGNPASSITYVPKIDARGKTFFIELLAPSETPLANTNNVTISLYQDESHSYLFRNDSGGFFVAINTPGGYLQWAGFMPNGVRIQRIGFSFLDGLTYTTMVPVGGDPFGLGAPSPVDRLDMSSAQLSIASYTEEAEPETAILTRIVVGKNLDDITGQMSSMSVDRSLAGAFPDEVSFTEGSSSAQTTIDLISGVTDDERKHAAWQFSPFNSDSPFSATKTRRVNLPFSAAIEFQKHDGSTASFQRMIGSTRDIDVSVKNRSASLAALDYRDRLAGSVSLPIVDGEAQGCNATAFVSYALQSSGIPVAPPIADNCKLYQPLHGTTAPMIGGSPLTLSTYVTDTTDYDPQDFSKVDPGLRPRFIDNPKSVSALDAHWRHADHRATVGVVSPSTDGSLDVLSQSNAAGYFTAWVYADSSFVGEGPGTGNNPDARFAVSFWVSQDPTIYIEFGVNIAGEVLMAFHDPNQGNRWRGTAYPMPIDDQWHQIAIKYDFSAESENSQLLATNPDLGGPNSNWNIWNWSYASYAGMKANLPANDQWVPISAELVIATPMSDIQYVAVPEVGGCQYFDVPTYQDYGGKLPISSVELGGNLNTEPQEVWELVKNLAAADRASVYFDEGGNFHYSPLADRSTDEAQTVQKTVTSVDHITELDISQTIDSVKNTITVEYAPFQSVRGGVAWSTSDTFVLPGRSTTILRLSFDEGVSYIRSRNYAGQPVPWYWDNAWTWPPGTDGSFWGMACARKSLTDTSDIKNIVGLPWPRLVGGGGNYIDVEVQNPSSSVVYIFNDGQVPSFAGVDNAANKAHMESLGSPSIMLAGNKLSQTSPSSITVVDQFSIDSYSEQSFSFQNEYVQSATMANTIAGSLMSDLKDPVATATLTVIGDPRLELGDRIRVQDPEGNVFDQEFWIQGIEDTLDSGGYTQRLTVRQAHSTLYWAVDTNHNPSQDRWDRFSWG